SIPTFRPRSRTTSGKLSPVSLVRNVKTFPPAPQAKQWKICLEGLTVKEGFLSAWNGQSPLRFCPVLVRVICCPTTSVMSTRSLMRLMTSSEIKPLPTRAGLHHSVSHDRTERLLND